MGPELPGGTDHPSWPTVASTFLGYAAIIAVLLLVLFVLPWLVFETFGTLP
jgi:hypothetical protein